MLMEKKALDLGRELNFVVELDLIEKVLVYVLLLFENNEHKRVFYRNLVQIYCMLLLVVFPYYKNIEVFQELVKKKKKQKRKIKPKFQIEFFKPN